MPDANETALIDYADALAAAEDRNSVFRAAQAVAQSLIGHRLFTVMRFDAARMEVERLYSSEPASYPIGGRKKKRDTPWGEHVLEKGGVYIGRNADDIRWAFDDSKLILDLGLISVLNVPIYHHRTVIGTMNLLDRDDHYTPADAAVGRLIALGIIPEILS